MVMFADVLGLSTTTSGKDEEQHLVDVAHQRLVRDLAARRVLSGTGTKKPTRLPTFKSTQSPISKRPSELPTAKPIVTRAPTRPTIAPTDDRGPANDGDARKSTKFPTTLQPSISPTKTRVTTETKLVAYDSDAGSDSPYLIASALSGDGNTAVVGLFTDNNWQGAVIVYTRTSTDPDVWEQLSPKLVGGPSMGNSVAVDATGSLIVAGAQDEDDFQGAVYVFALNAIDNSWSHEARLLPSTRIWSQAFGTAVAVSSDGLTALVGAATDQNSNGQFTGAAFVFIKDAVTKTWQQQGDKLVGSDYQPSDEFHLVYQGWSVALSSDGNTAVVGG